MRSAQPRQSFHRPACAQVSARDSETPSPNRHPRRQPGASRCSSAFEFLQTLIREEASVGPPGRPMRSCGLQNDERRQRNLTAFVILQTLVREEASVGPPGRPMRSCVRKNDERRQSNLTAFEILQTPIREEASVGPQGRPMRLQNAERRQSNLTAFEILQTLIREEASVGPQGRTERPNSAGATRFGTLICGQNSETSCLAAPASSEALSYVRESWWLDVSWGMIEAQRTQVRDARHGVAGVPRRTTLRLPADLSPDNPQHMVIHKLSIGGGGRPVARLTGRG